MVTGYRYGYSYFCFFSEDLYLWRKTNNNLSATITNELSKTYTNSKYFKSFTVIIFLNWRVDKLERRDIFKGSFLKYNNLKSKTHLYNTHKNKLHCTIGAETIKKKNTFKLEQYRSFLYFPSMFLIKFYNNSNWMIPFFMSP